MANEEMKNVNEQAKKEEQMTTPGGVPVEVVKKHPIKDFFSNNKKKIAVGLGVAGAFGAGIIADKIGIKIPSKKESEEDTTD